MNYRLASRMDHLKTSEIREILKAAVNPRMISLAGGLPAVEAFPIQEIQQLTHNVLETEGGRALQYSTTEGDPELRRSIAESMLDRLGVCVNADHVLITSGSQQGLDLAGKVLLDEGDVVLCESPTYLGAINAFTAYGPRFVEVATDDDGMILADLERCLSENPRSKLIYVVPDFQNPSGRCWSIARRAGLLVLARRHQVPIIEDCPYAELRYSGQALPPLAALDDHGLVIFLGTFSKTFCPGLRLGWLAVEPTLYEKFVLVKQGADLHTSSLTQRLVATYMQQIGFDDAIVRIRSIYRIRRDAMLEALDRELSGEVRHTRPDGGLFLWAELPEGVNGHTLLARCLEQNVAFVPGGPFFPNGGHENTMRLNFSAVEPERIAEGIRRIAGVLHSMIDQNLHSHVA